MALCPVMGKVQYKTYYSASRRLRWEKYKHLGDSNGSVYKCKHCGQWHITYHAVSLKKGKYNRKRSSKDNNVT